MWADFNNSITVAVTDKLRNKNATESKDSVFIEKGGG